MKTNWTVSILDEAPAMTNSFEDFAGTFVEAVEFAKTLWLKHGRSVCVRSGADRAGFWWLRIANGIATCRNFNSGVPETQPV